MWAGQTRWMGTDGLTGDQTCESRMRTVGHSPSPGPPSRRCKRELNPRGRSWKCRLHMGRHLRMLCVGLLTSQEDSVRVAIEETCNMAC